jgi:acetyl esterase
MEGWGVRNSQARSAGREPNLLLRGVRSVLNRALTVRRTRHPQVDVETVSVPVGERALACRLHTPLGAVAAGPLLVFFHGGGFISCGLSTHDELCRILALSSGVRVLAVGYSLAPERSFPTQVEEAVAVCEWARGLSDRIGVVGDSSGGYLAVAATLRLNAVEPGRVCLLVGLYPLLQLDDDVWRRGGLRNLRVVGRIGVAIIRRLGGGRAASLLEADVGLLPATVLVSGGLDPTAPDTRAFAERLRVAGVTVEEVVAPWVVHGSFNLTHVSPRALRLLREVGERIGRMLA